MVHEWALAEAVVKAALEISKREGAFRVKEVVVTVGELQQVDLEVFKEAYNCMSRGTILEGSQLRIEVEEAQFECRICGRTWSFREILKSLTEEVQEAIHFMPEAIYAFARCPACGSVDFDIIKGRGIWIKSIKVTK